MITFGTPVKPTFARALHAKMHGHQKARSSKWVHASDITDTSYCPREFALIWKYKPDAERPSKAINTSLRYTFDMGNLLGNALIEMWGAHLVRGIWVCTGCGSKTLSFSPRPEMCGVCQKKTFKHRERYGTLFDKRFTYAVDAFVDLGESKLRVVELKTIKAEGTKVKDGFKDLLAPLASHSLRTAIYMEALEREGFGDKVYTDEAIILYLCKGYGFKDDVVVGYGIGMDRTTPFKEYRVFRERYQMEVDKIFEQLEQISRVTKGEVDPIIPNRIASCNEHVCKRAQSCPVADLCWSMNG